MFNKNKNIMNKGPVNNRYFNVRANNAQSYLNGIKAMKPGSSHMSAGMRPQFKIPGIKMSSSPKMNSSLRKRRM